MTPVSNIFHCSQQRQKRILDFSRLFFSFEQPAPCAGPPIRRLNRIISDRNGSDWFGKRKPLRCPARRKKVHGKNSWHLWAAGRDCESQGQMNQGSQISGCCLLTFFVADDFSCRRLQSDPPEEEAPFGLLRRLLIDWFMLITR